MSNSWKQKTRNCAQIARLEHQVDSLTQAVLHAQKQRFGPASEKMPVMQGQCSLFDGEDVIEEEEEKNISIREHKRPVRKKGDRERLIRELPVETVECVLNPEDAVCDICGQEMKVIGKKK